MPTCATVRSYDDHPSFEVLEPRLLLNGTVDLGLSAAEVPEVPPGYLLECDANGDGRVDGGDLGIFQQNYDPVGIGENIYQMGDWDLDGKIDGGDLSLWQQFYDPLGSDGLQNIGSGEFTTRAPGPGEVAINTAGYLISSPGYYILTADITAEASAIGINCGNVTLDLNGHTITWGTDAVLSDGVVTYNSWQSGNVGHAGIMSPSRPDRTDDFPGAFGWNPSRPNVVIGNGRIVQGNGSGLAYSHGIDLGGCQGAELHDLIIEVDAPDTQGLLVGRDADVHHMTFLHGGTHVTNRHQQLAVVVLSAGGEILQRHVVTTRADRGPQAVGLRICEAVRQCTDMAGPSLLG